MQGDVNQRDKAINEAGTYVYLTYYALNLNKGEKLFIVKNKTILKIS